MAVCSANHEIQEVKVYESEIRVELAKQCDGRITVSVFLLLSVLYWSCSEKWNGLQAGTVPVAGGRTGKSRGNTPE